MGGIHRERPGADAMSGATGEPAVGIGERVWMSPGWSNSYLVGTDDGRVVINTGMGFEGPLHVRSYAAVDESSTRAIVLTQGHYDHVGGVDTFRATGPEGGPDPDVVAQANFTIWRDDNERLESFRSRNSAFAFMDAILSAMEHARTLGVGAVAQSRPEPTVVVDSEEYTDNPDPASVFEPASIA